MRTRLNLIRSRGRGLRDPGDQTHSCQSETTYSMMLKLGDLVFVLKTRSDQILVKLINQGVAVALFSSRRPENFENENIFLCLKIAEINMGVNVGSRRTILDIKTYFF